MKGIILSAILSVIVFCNPLNSNEQLGKLFVSLVSLDPNIRQNHIYHPIGTLDSIIIENYEWKKYEVNISDNPQKDSFYYLTFLPAPEKEPRNYSLDSIIFSSPDTMVLLTGFETFITKETGLVSDTSRRAVLHYCQSNDSSFGILTIKEQGGNKYLNVYYESIYPNSIVFGFYFKDGMKGFKQVRFNLKRNH